LFAYLKEKQISCIVATHDGNDALSFADQMIVIKDNRILVKGSPTDLYQNPKEHYVAALFDDVNEILVDATSCLLYPHQIEIAENSDYKAVVKKCYFKGFYWLIEVEFDGQKVFLQHPKLLPLGDLVYLKFLSVPS
jgi:ABC-type sulfate/molybdate transport systems ATPase subunit